MVSSDHNTASDSKRVDLLRKLENPMGFIGESTLSHIYHDGKWMRVSDIIQYARTGPSEKDKVLSSLNERLHDIRTKMRSSGLSSDEAVSLFEEGITVKKAIYILRNDVAPDGDHSDTRRWLNYGRSIS